jgi:radical SAM enzyme (TIGR01210 family)
MDVELKEHERTMPLAQWTEKDSIDGVETDAFVIILDGPGCGWSKKVGCTMCGYCNDVRDGEISESSLVEQMSAALDRFNGESYLKIFTSGSFLDPKEIPIIAQDSIMSLIPERKEISRVLIESRPEFIESDRLKKMHGFVRNLEVAIGLETSSDIIRTSFIRKGFLWKDYLIGSKKVISAECLLKTYLLLKPPFIGEGQAISDMISSIRDIYREFPLSRVSINPMNIQSNTPVEKAFLRDLYRPPWLWSIVEVLLRAKEITEGTMHLMSNPTAGGKKRGSHNCGSCDREVLNAISQFSIDNDPGTLKGLDDCCMDQWRSNVEMSNLNHLL